MQRALDELLAVAERVLTQAGVPHALIGGCARNVYAAPRSTRDVDFAVVSDAEGYQRLSELLDQKGFTRRSETRAVDDAPVPDVALFSDDTGARIDLLFAHTSFEADAIARATSRALGSDGGLMIPVVTAEDLIVYKVLASRPRDVNDIEDVAKARAAAGAVIDWDHVERECNAWEMLSELAAIRKRVGV